jgi:transketolase
MNTRNIFFKTLEELAKKDKDIIFLTGDLGFSYMENFQKKFPDQFINCGTIEQSMIGIAVGLAKAKKKPYVYSTLNFILFRALEQIRNDVVCANHNVKLIGVSMSGFLGFSHNMLHEKEDINICNNIGLKHYKATLKNLENIIIKTSKNNKPCFIRL